VPAAASCGGLSGCGRAARSPRPTRRRAPATPTPAPHLLVGAPPREVCAVQQQLVGRARGRRGDQHQRRRGQRAAALEAVGVAQDAHPHDAVDHVEHGLGVRGARLVRGRRRPARLGGALRGATRSSQRRC
jgi:hypothetical protein